MLAFLSFPGMSFSTEECIILFMWNSGTGKTNYGDSSLNSENIDQRGMQPFEVLDMSYTDIKSHQTIY